MNCQKDELLIHAYLDGELDLLNTVEMEAHLKECARCAEAYENHRSLRSRISGGEFYFKAPDRLTERIHVALKQADEASPESTASFRKLPAEMASRRSPKGIQRRFSWVLAGLAAAAAMAAVVVWRFDPAISRSGQGDLLARGVLASHVRSLMASHLTDVPSSDQHTVKPWFNGKLDFSPPVKDLAGAGFPLVGGRLDYLEDRPVAALVYQRRKHFINLFIWPSQSDSGEKTVMRQGYNLMHWTEAGMAYWAVSDLNATELQEFVQLLHNRNTHLP